MSNGGTQYSAFPPQGSLAASGVAIAELDGQPGDDLAFSYQGSSSAFGLIHGGTTLGAYPDVSIPTCATGVELRAGNLAGGALQALVLTCEDRVRIVQATGGGAFATVLDWPVNTPEKVFGASALLADFDGDGDLDAVVLSGVASGATTLITLFQNNGQGTMTPVSVPGSVVIQPFSRAAVGDVNGDGKPDVVLSCSTSSTPAPLTVLLNVSP